MTEIGDAADKTVSLVLIYYEFMYYSCVMSHEFRDIFTFAQDVKGMCRLYDMIAIEVSQIKKTIIVILSVIMKINRCLSILPAAIVLQYLLSRVFYPIRDFPLNWIVILLIAAALEIGLRKCKQMRADARSRTMTEKEDTLSRG